MSPEYEFKFDIIRDRYYADYRYRYFLRSAKECTFFGLILMGLGGYFVDDKTISMILGIFGSVMLITNAVFDFQADAVFWKNISERYSSLLQEYKIGENTWSDEKIREFNAKLEEISSKDKNYKRVLSEKAHNATNHELGCERKYDFDINWFKYITANIFAWDSGSLRYVDKKQGE